MAEAPLRIEYEYFPDPTRGVPVANGFVYVGLPNTDPTVLANRVDTILIQQDGTRVTIQPASQPFDTSPGGVIEYQGSPAIIRVTGTVSISVRDSLGVQVYYNPTANISGGSSGSGSAVSVSGLPLNHSFETETNPPIPDNWTITADTGGAVATDTDSAHGFKSLKFTSTGAAGAGKAVSDRFNVLSNNEIDLRFSYKSSSIDTLTEIHITYYDNIGTPIATNTVYSEAVANPAGYQQFIVRDTSPALAIECEIILYGVKTGGATVVGTTHFDDIILSDITDNAIIKTTSVPSGVNAMIASDGATGNAPTIDQDGPDDVGVDIEGVNHNNGIATGNFAGSFTGNLIGNADTVTTNADLTGEVTSVGNAATIGTDIIQTVHYKKPASGVTPNKQIIKRVSPGGAELEILTAVYSADNEFVNGVSPVDFKHINIGTVLIPGVVTVSFSYRTIGLSNVFVRILVNGVEQFAFTTLGQTVVNVEQDLTVDVGDNVTLQAKADSASGRISNIQVSTFDKNFAIS